MNTKHANEIFILWDTLNTSYYYGRSLITNVIKITNENFILKSCLEDQTAGKQNII